MDELGLRETIKEDPNRLIGFLCKYRNTDFLKLLRIALTNELAKRADRERKKKEAKLQMDWVGEE